MKRVLSLDGGGIRGIVPARLCAEIESITGRPARETFDLIAGTSTGGILACGLACGLPAAQLLWLYIDRGGEIFGKRHPGIGILSAKYDPAALEEILGEALGERRLSGVPVNLLVPARDLTAAENRLFASWEARADPTKDAPLRAVARATSAAPYYFPPLDYATHLYWDGGVFANNPAMLAFGAARALWPGEEVKLLSAGTGWLEPAAPSGRLGWGAAGVLPGLIEQMMDADADAADDAAALALGGNYLRIDIALPARNAAMDDASPGNIAALAALGETLAVRSAAAIREFLA